MEIDTRPLTEQYPEIASKVRAITENVAWTINGTTMHIEGLPYPRQAILEAVIQELQEAV